MFIELFHTEWGYENLSESILMMGWNPYYQPISMDETPTMYENIWFPALKSWNTIKNTYMLLCFICEYHGIRLAQFHQLPSPIHI